MRLRQHIAALAGVLLVGSSLVLPATAAAAAPLPSAPIAPASFKACEATSGVGVVHPSFPSKPQPVDENVNVYVGGNFTRLQGSELEGQLVVNGNAALGGNANYNMGYVGAGSGIVPVADQDLIRVGGDFTLNGTTRALVSSIAANGSLLPGNVRIGGTASPASQISLESGSGQLTQNMGRADALGPVFAEWANDDFSILHDFVARNQTGTPGSYAFADGGYLELRGTAGADRHLITIPGSQLTGQGVVLKLVDIDPTDVTVINVTGSTANLNILDLFIGSTQIVMGAPVFGQVAARTLWTFPTATDVTLAGGQVPGSVVVPSSGSITKQNAGGANGRYWVGGDLSQDRAGSEFHAFPFLGDADSSCGTPMIAPVVPVVVAPVLPTVVEAVCDAGAVTTPSVTLPADTADVVYSKSGAEVAGGTVTVSAVAQGDSVFEETVSGWTISGDRKTATRVIVLADPDCAVVPVVVAPVLPTVVEAVCDAGAVTTPSVTLPADTADVVYSKSGAEVAGGTVTVSAVAQGDSVFEETVSGWTISGDRKTATRVIVLADPDCAVPPVVVAPVLPTVVESVCESGVATAPSVTLPADTTDVVYSKSGGEVAGGTVTVSAVAQGNTVFEETVSGWTISGDRKTATRVVELTDPGCVILPVAVAPVTPTIENVCVAGGTSTPTVVFDVSTGVTYEITQGSVVPGTTVTVTATAVPGYVLDPADGWTLASDNFTATMQMEIPAALDCAPVAVDPGITQATCAAGATLTLPTTPGIVYTSSNASPAAGETITITATPASGHVLTAGDGWTLHSNGTATKQFTLTKPTCGTGAGATPGGGDLATTGGTPVPGWVIGGGLAAVLAGAVLLFVRRRAQGSTDA